jgi:hypothetical protein
MCTGTFSTGRAGIARLSLTRLFRLDAAPVCGGGANGLPGGISLGSGPLQPVRCRHLIRPGDARIMPGDDRPGQALVSC